MTPPPTTAARDVFHEPPRTFSPEPLDFPARRRPPELRDLALTAEAHAWLASLSTPDLPAALTARFPRIVNNIVDRLQHPAELHRYMEQLLVDQRGNRSGFPPSVMQDLIQLDTVFMRMPRYRNAPTLACAAPDRLLRSDRHLDPAHLMRPPTLKRPARPQPPKPSLLARLRSAFSG